MAARGADGGADAAARCRVRGHAIRARPGGRATRRQCRGARRVYACTRPVERGRPRSPRAAGPEDAPRRATRAEGCAKAVARFLRPPAAQPPVPSSQREVIDDSCLGIKHSVDHAHGTRKDKRRKKFLRRQRQLPRSMRRPSDGLRTRLRRIRVTGGGMMTLGRRYRMRAALLAVGMACSAPWLLMGQTRGSAVAIDPDDIGGTVTSAKGPEAGVWVIAETTETPTKFAKVVVTDDQGRYVVPDLPASQLSGVRARLRPGRLAARARQTGPAPRSEGRHRARCQGRRRRSIRPAGGCR